MDIHWHHLYNSDFVADPSVPRFCGALVGRLLLLVLRDFLPENDFNFFVVVRSVVQQLMSVEVPSITDFHTGVEIDNEAVRGLESSQCPKIDESFRGYSECRVPFVLDHLGHMP